ncbi:hypothetical protein PV726_32080 [Streptomyces europaeiscabiei]|uniref:hypothetical protein n=1 Tax=Streptomyces europaeiscabiei TaxID=146819 RepID=UPI0029A8E187|nr:hypothetical protein [Streptomyces europaeiscabiei]MDX3694895.1 hypothetical protein [Streptomyces europaeiscabiei]
MVQLAVEDLSRILADAAGDKHEGVRLVYDGASLCVSSPDRPHAVLSQAECRGPATGPWELTAYRASLPAVRAWLQLLEVDERIDVSPLWGGPEVLVVFTAGQSYQAFPVLECPSASGPPVRAAADRSR